MYHATNHVPIRYQSCTVDKTFSYTGAWNSNVPTESPKSTDFEITPKGTAISAAEIEEEENQDNTNNTNNTDNTDNNKWVCELSNGERISDWTFNIPTTKQVDKKTRIIPEKGRTIQVTTWLMKPALTEEEEAAAQELIATQEAAESNEHWNTEDSMGYLQSQWNPIRPYKSRSRSRWWYFCSHVSYKSQL